MSRLHTAVAQQFGMKEGEFFLFFDGRRLLGANSLSDSQVENGDVIDVIVHQRGC